MLLQLRILNSKIFAAILISFFTFSPPISLVNKIDHDSKTSIPITGLSNNYKFEPKASALGLYAEFPHVDSEIFSPSSSPGFMDQVSIIGTPLQNLNYNFTVDAIPQSLNIRDVETPSVCYIPSTDKLLLFYVNLTITSFGLNNSIIMMESNDHGDTWINRHEIVPSFISDYNFFDFEEHHGYQCPIAAEWNGLLHLLYRKNSTLIYYMKSTNQGNSWSEPQLIQNGTIDYIKQNYGRLDMAIDPSTGYIHVAAATCLSSSSNNNGIFFFNSTDAGLNWSVPKHIPLLGEMAYTNPCLSFNSTGAAFLTANNYTLYSSGKGFVVEFLNGLWDAGNIFVQTGSDGSDPTILSTVDRVTGTFFLYNKTKSGPKDGQMWKTSYVGGNNYTKITDGPMTYSSPKVGRLQAISNYPIFVSIDYSENAVSSIIFANITEPMDIIRRNGSAYSGELMSIPFDGHHDGRHGTMLSSYNNFYLWFYSTNGTESKSYSINVRRDDKSPILANLKYNSYISPVIEDGIYDTLDLTFSSSEDIEYSCRIFTEKPQEIKNSIVSSSFTSKEHPKIIIDELGRIYAFYISKTGYDNGQLCYHFSDNGGITWSEEKSLTLSGYDNDDYGVYSDKAGLYVFTEYAPYSKYAAFKTQDGGETWQITPISMELYPELITVSLTGKIYAITYNTSFLDARLFCSNNEGRTWSQEYDLPGDMTEYTEGKLGIDNVNNMLYFFYNNLSINIMNFVQMNLDTLIPVYSGELLNYNFENYGLIHGLRIYPANSMFGSTQISFKNFMSNSSGFFLESRYSMDNGTTWILNETVQTSIAELLNQEYNLESDFFQASTRSYLFTEIQIVGDNTLCMVSGESNIVARSFGRVSYSKLGNVLYNGRDFNGANLPDGRYTCQLDLIDYAKNFNTTNFFFCIDNHAPTISNINWTTDPIHPLPLHNSTITFTAADAELHLERVEVWYKHSNTGWINASVMNIGGSDFRANFTANASSSRLDFYIKALDLAGNIQIADNNHTYYGWNDPTIEMLVIPILDLTTTFDDTPLKILVLEGSTYIHDVQIVTSYGDKVSCELINGTYFGSVPKSPKLDSFSYQVMYFDKFNRTKIIYQNTLFRPLISITKLDIPSINLKFTSDDVLNFSVNFTPNLIPYIVDVKVVYRLDHGEWVNQSFIFKSEIGSFEASLGSFKTAHIIELYMVYEDYSGVYIIEGTNLSFEIIPAMPNIQLTTNQSLWIGIISAIVGLLIGTLYGLFLRSQQYDPLKTYSDAFHSSKNIFDSEKNAIKNSETVTDTQSNNHSQSSFGILNQPILLYQPSIKKIGIYIFFCINTCVGIGIIYTYSKHWFEYATGLAVILSLFMTFFFESLLEITSESAIRNKAKMFNARLSSLLFLSGTFLALVIIFWIGANIPWFNYYVYSDSFRIGRIIIPILWISVAGTFFTSMLLVVFTTQIAIKNYFLTLNLMVQEGASLHEVFQFREKRILSIKQQLMFKTLGFIAFVVISIIAATNLSYYMNLGMIMLLPFLLGCVLSIMYFGKVRVKGSKLTKIHPKTICHKCGAEILQGTFCSACGTQLTKDIIELEKSAICKHCQSLNAAEAEFCRICGQKLTKN